MFKKLGFWVAVLFVVLALVSIGFYFFQKSKNHKPEEIITKSSEIFKPKLKAFLNIVDNTVNDLQKSSIFIDVDAMSRDSLNNYFSIYINEKEHLQGVVILGSEIEYALFKDDKSWLMSHSISDTVNVDWFRLNDGLEVVSEWTDRENLIMSKKNLQSIKLSALNNDQRVWVSLESEVAEKREIVFNVFKLGQSKNTDIVALLYKTTELGQRFNQALTFENPLVTMITTDRLVTPMRTTDPELLKTLKDLSIDVDELIQGWLKEKNRHPKIYKFENQKLEYLLSIDTITPSSGVSAFSIAISQHDLLGSLKKVEQAFLYAAVMFLLFALFAYLTTYRKWKKTNAPDKSLKELSPEEVEDMISKGETEFVEFKSSLRWDYQMNKVNKILEIVILKTIAAFTNASGGVLIIGVDDDFNVLGLEPDFNTLAKKNVDYFELHLRKLINNQYGVNFSNKFILTRFPIIKGRTICVLQIAPASSPQFLKLKNKSGAFEEKFYVRSGNASQQISSLKEINEYIEGHYTNEA